MASAAGNVKEPDKGDLVGKTKPVMGAPALAQLYEIFLGQGGGALELVAGKHCRCDTAKAEVRKDASLAYKITRISLAPFFAGGPSFGHDVFYLLVQHPRANSRKRSATASPSSS